MVSRNDRNIKNRYLNRRRREKPMTICIAAVCDDGRLTTEGIRAKIVLCADHLVSAGIQFEGGESKIRYMTDYCYIMNSSNDSALSDLVLDNVKEYLDSSGTNLKIKDIAKVVSKECINLKKETINREVLSRYNLVKDSINPDIQKLAKRALNDTKEYEQHIYPEFEFLIAGLELPNQAHIYTVNQNGEIKSNDSLAFTAIGSGMFMAFAELSKYPYSRATSLVEAVPRVYFAKSVAQKMQGVGVWTDLYVLHFAEDPNTKKIIPAMYSFTDEKYFKKLSDAYTTVQKFEISKLAELFKDIGDMLNKPKDDGK